MPDVNHMAVLHHVVVSQAIMARHQTVDPSVQLAPTVQVTRPVLIIDVLILAPAHVV